MTRIERAILLLSAAASIAVLAFFLLALTRFSV